jgi:hypothetical protein
LEIKIQNHILFKTNRIIMELNNRTIAAYSTGAVGFSLLASSFAGLKQVSSSTGSVRDFFLDKGALLLLAGVGTAALTSTATTLRSYSRDNTAKEYYFAFNTNFLSYAPACLTPGAMVLFPTGMFILLANLLDGLEKRDL